MNEMSGVEAFVRMLLLFGVKHIFALYGDISLPFYRPQLKAGGFNERTVAMAVRRKRAGELRALPGSEYFCCLGRRSRRSGRVAAE
jgi:hypothetical protein